MSIRKLILHIHLFLFLFCNSKRSAVIGEVQKTELKNSVNQLQKNQFLKKKTTQIEIICDDQFMMRALERDLIFSSLEDIYRPKRVYKKTVSNRHYPDHKDTILFFTVNKDSVQFYKGLGNTLLQKIIITSPKVVIDKNIRVGVNKALFRQKFNAKLLSDILIIQDTEGGNMFVFYFKENKLIQILYKVEYMD